MRRAAHLNPWLQLGALTLATIAVILLVNATGLIRPSGSGGEALQQVGREDLPDFRTFPTVEAKKTNFFGFLRPIVRAENRKLRREHERLKALGDALADGGEVAPEQWAWVRRKAKAYRVDLTRHDRAEVAGILARRVDVIPASLVLAQAAKESAWGTSRFAREGNNLFGEWCFTQGCGLVPGKRQPGKSHEVETFDTVRASVASYLHNLNSHPKYQELRTIRARLRRQGKAITGFALAQGLEHYSARGQEYVAEVRALIRHNDLGQGGHGS